jgi:hypothetical protein
MVKSFVAGGLILLLGACGYSPGFYSVSVSFSNPSRFSVLQEKFTGGTQLFIQSEPVPDATKPLVKSGKLFVGNRVFTSGAFSGSSVSWRIASPCADLPQGLAINLRYELFDAAGTLLQKNTSPVLTTISTC